MNAFVPTSRVVTLELVLLLAVTIALVQLVATLRGGAARPLAWTLVALALGGGLYLARAEPPGVVMLAVCGTLLMALKAPVLVEGARRGAILDARRRLLFTVAWPGMRPALFQRPPAGGGGGGGAAPSPELRAEGRAQLRAGLIRVVAGAAFVAGALLLDRVGVSRILVGVVLLPGLSLLLHFGIFNVLGGAWRLAGVPVAPLFRAPLAATGLGDFWSRRWNIAFSEMTQLIVYRPLAAVVGTRVALVCGFVFSGLLHEAAISVPARAGYGLPSLYFLLHGALVLVERRRAAAGHPVDAVPWRGRLWTLLWLALPLPLLFHPPFVRNVLLPLVSR